MAKPKKNDNPITLIYAILAIVLIVFVAGTLSSYGVKLFKDAKKQVADNYVTLADGVAFTYDKEITTVTEVIKIFADYIKDDDVLSSEDNMKYLSSIANNMDIANAYIINTDYSAVDTKGNQYEMITELPGYEDAFKGVNTASKFIKNAEGQLVMLLCTPVNTMVEMKGYVLVEYTPRVMDDLLEAVRFSPQNTYALISSDGKVIERVGAKSAFVSEGGDILDTNGVVFDLGNMTLLKQCVSLQKSGQFLVTKNNEAEYVYMVPVGNYQALVVLCVDKAIVETGNTKASLNIRNMLTTMSGIIGGFLVLLLIVTFVNKARFNLESEDLKNKADTDQLTDLYNKMATERLIKEYMDGEGADKVSMLFLLDVDNFKKINDTMGHAFGDEVLQSLGHQIKAWFRVNDIIGRIGGDEFMIFIKDVKNEEVIKREGSRIMQFFEGFQVGDYTKYSPTASIGGAVFPTDAKDFESLYKAADKAVYKSKKAGKNRVSFYSDLNKTEQETEPDKTGRD